MSPRAVDKCVESILAKNPDMEKSEAWAICNKMYKEGKLKNKESLKEEAKKMWRKEEN